MFACVHQGLSGSASSSGATQLLVDDDSILAASLAQLFVVTAHLFGSVKVPQPLVGGFVAGVSHLYQASLTVACQNF